MTGQVTNHQPIFTKMGRSENLFFSHLDIHTNNVLAEMLNNKVKVRLNDIIIKIMKCLVLIITSKIHMKKKY